MAKAFCLCFITFDLFERNFYSEISAAVKFEVVIFFAFMLFNAMRCCLGLLSPGLKVSSPLVISASDWDDLHVSLGPGSEFRSAIHDRWHFHYFFHLRNLDICFALCFWPYGWLCYFYFSLSGHCWPRYSQNNQAAQPISRLLSDQSQSN